MNIATMIVGDLHLGRSCSIGKPGLGSALNSRIADQFYLLEWILEQAIDNNVTSIVLTGDICEDVKPDYIIMILFIQWIKKCESNNIEIHIIAGNHDIMRSGTHYTSSLDIIQSAEIPNTFIHKQIETVYNGMVGFTLVPFRDRRSFNLESTQQSINRIKDILLYESIEIPYTYNKVLIGHLAIEGSIIVGDEFDDTANELMCPIEMFQNYEYVWMGHVHKPQVRSQKPYVAHIGSMDISDFGETDHKKIIVIFNPSLPNLFKEIIIPTRPLRRIRVLIPSNEINTNKIILDAIDTVEKETSFKDAIVKLEVQLMGPDVPNADRSLIEKTIYNYGAHYISNFMESRTITVVPIEKKSTLDSTISPKIAVKMYSDHLTFESDDKQKFINICNDIIEEYGKSN